MKTLTLKLERFAGRLAVSIPDDATTRFQLTEGQPVILSIPTTADEASNVRKDAMTLAQKLALYEANPFAVRITWAGGNVSYVLAAQPKSFDWRRRGAKPHPMKQAPHAAFKLACSALNQIITIC